MVSDSSCVLPAVSAVHFLCRALSHSAYIRSGNYWITQRCPSRQTTSTLRPLYRRGGFVKRLWLFFFPLLFMPNAGFSHRTDFGVLEVCDWLIAPFIVLLMIAASAKYEQRVAKLNPLLW